MHGWMVMVAVLASCKPGAPAIARAPEQDALWKLAPPSATGGVVVSSRGLQGLESAWREVDRLLDTTPELAGLSTLVRQRLPVVLRADEVSLAAAGMAPERGAAVFWSPGGGRLVVLPVVDRARFLAFANGTTDADGDHVGELACRMVGDRYACAQPAELLRPSGGGALGERIRLARARGDIELAVDEPETDTRLAAVAELARGSLVVRGAIHSRSGPGKIVNAGVQRFDPSKLAGFGVLHLGPALASAEVPSEPLAAGITLADLVRSMTGPIVLSLPVGMRQGVVRVPVKDPNLARTLVTHCEDIEYLAIASSTFRDGVCKLTVPGAGLDLDVSVDGGELLARATSGGGVATAVRPTPLARELAAGAWAYAIYGRGSVVGAFTGVRSDATYEVRIGMRALAWLSEIGVGVRREGDGVRFVAGVHTVWSYPDDVVAKSLALSFEQIVDAATLETMRELSATAPESALADDLRAGNAVLAPVAVLSAIAGFVAGGRLAPQELRDLGIGRAPVTEPAEALAKMTAFKDAMCACHDTKCAQQVSDEMTAWSQEQARAGYQRPTLSPADQARAAALGEAMSVCMQHAFGMRPEPAASEYIAKNRAFKDRLCACKDLACGEAASRELTAWSEAYVASLPPGSTMSPADDRAMQTIEGEVHACMRRLKSGAM